MLPPKLWNIPLATWQGGKVNVAVYGAGRALSKRAWVAADGVRGLLKYSTSNVAGKVLAVGPQAYLDYKSATTISEFCKRVIYNRPANVASAIAGIVGGKLKAIVCDVAGLGMIGLVVVIGESFIAGLGASYLIDSMGWDKSLGNYNYR